MKPQSTQSTKARKALNKSENSNNNNDATCFDFNELLVILDVIDSRVKIPIGSSSTYEKDDNSTKEAILLSTRDEPCQGITSFSKGLILLAEVDYKVRDASLMVREVILKLREEYGCDFTSLRKAKEASRKFLNEIMKIRDEFHPDITSLSKGLTVAEADSRIEEVVLNFRRDIICLGVAARHNNAKEAKLKFQEALKVRDESRCQSLAVRRFRSIFGYHWELGMEKRRHLKEQRTKFPMYFA